MHKKSKIAFRVGIIIILFTSFLCSISCAEKTSVVSLVVPISVHTQEASVAIPLKALNKNARNGIIASPDKSPYMYFAFEKGPELQLFFESKRYALELELEPIAAVSVGEPAAVAEFSVGLLYGSDFSASGKLKQNVFPQHPVTAQVRQKYGFTISIGFAGIEAHRPDIRGFVIYAQSSVRLKRAAILPARYGWVKSVDTRWCGLTADGGVVPMELFTDTDFPLRTELPRPSSVMPSGTSERESLVVFFNKAASIDLTARVQSQVSFNCNNRNISVYRAPNVHRMTFDGCLFSEDFLTIELVNKATDISGIIVEYTMVTALKPITADAGLIPDWPQETWRQPSYELFSWEQFPSVLIFDFADYAIQDTFLKRIAFFAEKKGFTGKILSDAAMQSFHGFNAHDYRADTLARFFQKAEKENFPLNRSELYLRTILLHNGIITETENGIEAGHGAIISLSRQSSKELRYRLLTHECLHGIYFTEESFRETVSGVFQRTDRRAVLFLRRYFEIYPSLNYNTDDDYLLQNEFMAYILQQGREHLQSYYVNRLSLSRAINAAEPELCKYIRDTNAEAFMQAAEQMDAFLYTKWGLKGGRVRLVKIQAL